MTNPTPRKEGLLRALASNALPTHPRIRAYIGRFAWPPGARFPLVTLRERSPERTCRSCGHAIAALRVPRARREQRVRLGREQ